VNPEVFAGSIIFPALNALERNATIYPTKMNWDSLWMALQLPFTRRSSPTWRLREKEI